MAEYSDVIVIGAGQAGLAVSHCLTAEGIDHIVLERGAVANRWRAERWASLRLLTPNWMTRLPGYTYDGSDPDGYMMKDELVAYLNRYARSFEAPVREFTTVVSVTRDSAGFLVETAEGLLRSRAVVIATGACDRPKIPDWARGLAPEIERVTTETYNHPGDIAEGRVLVVGGSATGVQLAEELHLSGREVTLAVGSHVPLPRVYRGHDIMLWMDKAGILSEARDPSIPSERALAQPSLQLVGSTPQRDVGLERLATQGVQIVGRAVGAHGTEVALSGTLATEIQRAEKRRKRLLSRIDDYIAKAGADATWLAQSRTVLKPGADPRQIDLAREGIRTVLFATGFRRDYTWLNLPVLDGQGELKQQGGVCELPGLYAMALPFMRRRNSTFIDGVGADARDITHHICNQLGHASRVAA